MKTKKETVIRSDMSPAVSPEARKKHDLEAEKTNYKIALSELSLYIDRSTLHTGKDHDAPGEHAWTDHRGQIWLSENPISAPARDTLEMLLGVIRCYEGKYGEKSREEQALSDIASVRATGHEQSPSRLANFERQEAQPDTEKGSTAEQIPGHGIEIER